MIGQDGIGISVEGWRPSIMEQIGYDPVELLKPRSDELINRTKETQGIKPKGDEIIKPKGDEI